MRKVYRGVKATVGYDKPVQLALWERDEGPDAGFGDHRRSPTQLGDADRDVGRRDPKVASYLDPAKVGLAGATDDKASEAHAERRRDPLERPLWRDTRSA